MNTEPHSEKFRPAPEGWRLQTNRATFSSHAGPFYFREDGEPAGVGFYAESRHKNFHGVVHGGILLTLADMTLWEICRREVGMFKGFTVTLNTEFVTPGPLGSFIEASGDVVKVGRKLMFARGLISANSETLMSFSGTVKRIA